MEMPINNFYRAKRGAAKKIDTVFPSLMLQNQERVLIPLNSSRVTIARILFNMIRALCVSFNA